MSRLNDAITALRRAAGDRNFVLVIDKCGVSTTAQCVDVFMRENQPTYVVRGLLIEADEIIKAKYPVVIDPNDDEEDDATT